MSKTGIICTIGPACDGQEKPTRMIESGMKIARLNFSHGTLKDHHKRIRDFAAIKKKTSHKLKILQDLEGFRIRIGSLEHIPGRAIKVKEGHVVILSSSKEIADQRTLPLDFSGSLTAIKPGNQIFVDDGYIAMKATKVTKDSVHCRVTVPGTIKEFKGVNIPSAQFPFTGLREKDKIDIQFGIDNKVNFIAQSFVRRAEDITDIRKFINRRKYNCPLIAKIENKEGLKNLDEIIEVSDGIMIARGDLGVSLPIYKVPILQKMIIKKCRQKNKMVITATQMLESMTTNRRPTRAEVSDVANAILDGSDYVMLSGETAMGKYPVESVRMMQKVINFTERSKIYKTNHHPVK
jgi:pyruvate kinase